MRSLAVSALMGLVLGMTSGCALIAVGGADDGTDSGDTSGLESPGSASSGWTAGPTTPDPALLAEAINVCLVADDLAPGLADAPVLQDQRGPDTAAFLWVRQTHEAACLATRDTNGHVSAQGRSLASGGEVEGDGPVMALTGLHVGSSTMVVGDIAPGTDRVEITTASGRALTASDGLGRFIGWWPGYDPPASVRSFDARGTQLAEIRWLGGTIGPSDFVLASPGMSPVP